MKCIVCKNVMKRKKTTIELRLKGDLIIIDGIPADVCDYCGEKVLSPEVVDSVSKIYKNRNRKKMKKIISVPVYSFVS
jgi:YgiT-type zinc finger domain-containing protein